MDIKETKFPGLFELRPRQFGDERGSFFESYNEGVFYDHFLPTHFRQDNESFSKKGVLRGLHFQKPPYAQGKLVRVVLGRVLDVAVDLREGSPTFLQVYTAILDCNQKNMLYVPEGFAHGFLALSDVIFHYKCTSFYRKEAECGVKWDDPTLNINWYGDTAKIVSEKDQELPYLDGALTAISKSPDSAGQFIYKAPVE